MERASYHDRVPRLTEQPIDPAALLASVRRDGDGGLALFVGVVRDRLGSLAIGDVAVAVAAAAPHRDAAFTACRAGIEAIKARVPIWKKEFGPDGSFWVEPCADSSHGLYGNPDSHETH